VIVSITSSGHTGWEPSMRIAPSVTAPATAPAGARPGEVVLNAYGYGLFTGGLGPNHLVDLVHLVHLVNLVDLENLPV
jgi:phenylacetate-coenzyme A ligase PaaK-like adenylate-forming protein